MTTCAKYGPDPCQCEWCVFDDSPKAKMLGAIDAAIGPIYGRVNRVLDWLEAKTPARPCQFDPPQSLPDVTMDLCTAHFKPVLVEEAVEIPRTADRVILSPAIDRSIFD